MSEPIRTRSSYDGSKPAHYPELPEPLELGTYDNHTHLEIADGETPMSVSEHLDAMRAVGMLGAVQVGVTLESSRWSAKVAESEPMLLAAVALHPTEAPLYATRQELDDAIAGIAELATEPRVRAIGETGLDFFRTEGEAELEAQLYSFERHIEIAKQNDIALMIHDRDAHGDVVETLTRVGAPERTVFHCYSGDAEMAKECVAKGYILSFAGTVTFKNAPQLREAVKLVPLNQLLVETDSPFLAPAPHRGALNTPAQIPHILRLIAAERGESLLDLTRAVSDNAERIFGSFSS